MNIELFREYCLKKKAAEETFPFGEETIVFKVMGKMFALIGLDDPDNCNLKCNPDKAVELRSEFEAVKPGYHMNKQHWNTVHFNKDLPDKEILKLIDHSYELVAASLTKKIKEELNRN